MGIDGLDLYFFIAAAQLFFFFAAGLPDSEKVTAAKSRLSWLSMPYEDFFPSTNTGSPCRPPISRCPCSYNHLRTFRKGPFENAHMSFLLHLNDIACSLRLTLYPCLASPKTKQAHAKFSKSDYF